MKLDINLSKTESKTILGKLNLKGLKPCFYRVKIKGQAKTNRLVKE